MYKILLALALLGVSAFAELKIMTENFLPYNYEHEGKVKGLCSAVVKSVQKSVGNTTPILVRPWSESYNELQNGKNIALFCTTRTEQREKLFKWVGPIAYSNLVFQESTLNPTNIKTMEDAKKAGYVGVLKNDSSYEYLKSQGFDKLKVYDTEQQMYLALTEGDFALTTGNELNLPLLIKDLNLPKRIIRNTPVVIYRKGMYVAFSKDVSADLIRTWQSALDKIKESGEYETLRVKALQEAYKDSSAN